jgi:hypothetical protein
MSTKFVSTKIVPCNCRMLFELSWYSGRCTPILSTGNISSLFLSLAAGQIEHLPRCLPPPFFTVVGFRFYYQLCLCYVTGLHVPQAAFSLSHPILLYKDPHCSQTNKHNRLMIQAIPNWGVAMESWVTTPAMGANIIWLQNMSSFVSVLCCMVAGGDTLETFIC